MNVDLLVYKDGQPLKTVSVTLPVIIGRGTDATFTIKHPLLSRKHCEVFEENGAVQVRDLASLNGTFVNGSRVESTLAVDSGSQLKLGAVVMEVQFNGAVSEDTIASNNEAEAFDLGGTAETAETEVMAAAEPEETGDLPDFEVSSPASPPSADMLDLGDFEVTAPAVEEPQAAQDLPSLTDLAEASGTEPAETAVETPVPAAQPVAAEDPWAAPSESPKVAIDDDDDLDAFLKDLG
jgi:hypothetical protein